MSQDSLAAFRKGLGPELNALAEEHLKHEYDHASMPQDLSRY